MKVVAEVNMKIYTKTGDSGYTQYLDDRVKKCCLGIKCLGAVDELMSVLGVIRATTKNSIIYGHLKWVQVRLFALNSMLATTKELNNPITKDDTDVLEKLIDGYEKNLPPLKNFILPGGSPTGSQLHHARSICRHVETLLIEESANRFFKDMKPLLSFINRLSDYLFVAARYANYLENQEEEIWTD